MPIANVVVGTKILATKGNEIIDKVNELDVDLTAAESDIATLEGQVVKSGAWHSISAPFFGTVSPSLIYYPVPVFGASNITNDGAGTWTIVATGMYAIRASVTMASGVNTSLRILVNGSLWQTSQNVVEITMPLVAGQTVQIHSSVNTGGAQYNGGHFWIYKVGEV